MGWNSLSECPTTRALSVGLAAPERHGLWVTARLLNKGPQNLPNELCERPWLRFLEDAMRGFVYGGHPDVCTFAEIVRSGGEDARNENPFVDTVC